MAAVQRTYRRPTAAPGLGSSINPIRAGQPALCQASWLSISHAGPAEVAAIWGVHEMEFVAPLGEAGARAAALPRTIIQRASQHK